MDVAGQPLAFAGGGLDLQGAGQGGLTGPGDLDDVPDGDRGDPDQQHVVQGVAGGVAPVDEDVGRGHEGRGESGPAPAALDREGQDGTRRPDAGEGGPARGDPLVGVRVRGEQDAGQGDGQVRAQEALGAAGRVRDLAEGDQGPQREAGEVAGRGARVVELLVRGEEEQHRVDHGQQPVAGQGAPQRLLDRHAHDTFAFRQLPHPRGRTCPCRANYSLLPASSALVALAAFSASAICRLAAVA